MHLKAAPRICQIFWPEKISDSSGLTVMLQVRALPLEPFFSQPLRIWRNCFMAGERTLFFL